MSSVPIYSPTWEEFQDFGKFIAGIEANGAHESGIVKVGLIIVIYFSVIDTHPIK